VPHHTRGAYITTDEYGRETVTETFTCAHCQRVFVKPGPGEASGFCHQCFKPTCVPCGAQDKCDPFEKKLLRIEARDKLLRSIAE
jgi:hypothetical protein